MDSTVLLANTCRDRNKGRRNPEKMVYLSAKCRIALLFQSDWGGLSLRVGNGPGRTLILAQVQPWCGARRHLFDVGFGGANPNTCSKMCRFDFDQLGVYLLAVLDRIRTTCVKTTTRRWIDWRRDIAL